VSSQPRGLTVAVTGPTGDIGTPLLRALERSDAVDRVVGMARRPFDPHAEGWTKTSYRQGDILDREAVDALVVDADVVVHLAFIILGSHEEARRVNLEGTRNVFEATAAGAARLVYTSSVAAYGFHEENPQPLKEEIAPLGSEGFYYSAHKAELEDLLTRVLAGSETEAYVFRPCVVAGPDATTLIEQLVRLVELGGALGPVRRALEGLPFLRPVIPGPSMPFQLVHHDDVAAALVAAIEGRGPGGVYNLAGEGELTVMDLAAAMEWYAVPVPDLAVRIASEAVDRIPFLSAELEWIHTVRVPVLMDSSKARRELGWEPRYDAPETLGQTVASARAAQLIT
jgi:UDP-glucose 4-epimerase